MKGSNEVIGTIEGVATSQEAAELRAQLAALQKQVNNLLGTDRNNLLSTLDQTERALSVVPRTASIRHWARDKQLLETIAKWEQRQDSP